MRCLRTLSITFAMLLLTSDKMGGIPLGEDRAEGKFIFNYVPFLALINDIMIMPAHGSMDYSLVQTTIISSHCH